MMLPVQLPQLVKNKRSASYKYRLRELRRRRKQALLKRFNLHWSHYCCWRKLAEDQENLKMLLEQTERMD